MLNEIKFQARQAALELIEAAKLKCGDIIVIGCSSSEIVGERIGKGSSMAAAEAVFEGLYPVIKERGLFLAAQCCEHLNRAIIIEKALAEKLNLEEVNVRPMPKAGGSFATQCFERFENAVAVEHIKAHAGMDIGATLIGMHLKEVAVPVRLGIKQIGQASLVCARTRAKFIGGERANYVEELK